MVSAYGVASEVISIDKKSIRKKYIDIRNSCPKSELLVFSESISEKLNQLEFVVNAKNIMCFVSFGSEVETHSLIKNWLKVGKNVAVPAIGNDRGVMHAVRISGFNELKACGKYGILEPTVLEDNIMSPGDFDVIIVPGSVFDIRKNRMGYGAGFYDRFLSHTGPLCRKIGICFDFQVADEIPHEEHDVPLDLLITEKRIIY